MEGKRSMEIKNKVLIIIMILIIIAGFIMVGFKGFNVSLYIREHNTLEYIFDQKFEKKDVKAILTDMDEPLGNAVGNTLEVIEAINTLKGNGPKDLTELCLKAGSIMLMQAKIVDSLTEGEELLKTKIKSGEAFNKFVEFVQAQHGDISYVLDTEKFQKAKYVYNFTSKEEGYLKRIKAFEIGEFAMNLGAGREKIEDKIDYSAGILLNKKIGD